MTDSGQEGSGLAENAGTTANDVHPEWVTGELPDQYADVARQIAALKAQALQYEGVAGVLWQTGPALVAAVRELFVAIGFETETLEPGANFDLRVDLESGRHLLVEVVGGSERIDRRSPQTSRRSCARCRKMRARRIAWCSRPTSSPRCPSCLAPTSR